MFSTSVQRKYFIYSIFYFTFNDKNMMDDGFNKK